MMNTRHGFQRWIRGAHRLLFKKDLPRRLAVSFHALEEPNWNAIAEMVSYFRWRGYEFVDATGLCDEGSERAVYLSCDDNYQSWYRALPLFDELGVKVTFYTNSLPMRDRAQPTAISDYFDRIRHNGDRTSLSSEELVALVQHGHTIGSHTHSHAYLNLLPENEARTEILRGKEELENILGLPMVHFTYPFGLRRFFPPSLREYCREIGFQTISNAIPAVQFRGHRPYSINRSYWHFEQPVGHNIDNLSIDGRLFESLTGRSAVG